MNDPKPTQSAEPSRTDPLAPHRERIMYPILIAGVVCFTPFVINSILQKNYFSGFAALAVVVCYAVDVWAIWRKKRVPIPFAWLLIPMLVSMVASSTVQGIYGALWAYPAVLACFSVLSRRLANVCSAALLTAATLIVYFYIGPSVGVRYCASLALTIVVANCILAVVSGLQYELLNQAITDPLTGAFNRRHMTACLAEAVELSQRKASRTTVLLLDIDHFKQINDRFGHDSGDAVLKNMVRTVKERVRKTDKLFRMGGEEFLLLLPGADMEHAMLVAESLRQTIEEAGLLGDWPLTISIGVSQHVPEQTVDDWVRKADAALYQAKANGRNVVVRANHAGPEAEAAFAICRPQR